MELLETKRSKLPAVAELLSSPWICRASDLMHGDGTSAARHSAEEVLVEWDSQGSAPAAFTRIVGGDGKRRYRVDVILQVWATEKVWWDPRRQISRRYWRVLSGSGVYDLAFDRTTSTWQLIGIQD